MYSVTHSVVSNSLEPTDCSPPDYSVHGILQARILDWVAISFSRWDFKVLYIQLPEEKVLFIDQENKSAFIQQYLFPTTL